MSDNSTVVVVKDMALYPDQEWVVIPRLQEERVQTRDGNSVKVSLTATFYRVRFVHINKTTDNILCCDCSSGSLQNDPFFVYGKVVLYSEYADSLRKFSLYDGITVTKITSKESCNAYTPSEVHYISCMEWWKWVCAELDEIDILSQ